VLLHVSAQKFRRANAGISGRVRIVGEYMAYGAMHLGRDVEAVVGTGIQLDGNEPRVSLGKTPPKERMRGRPPWRVRS
jgi:hypothetical protein